MLTVQVRGKKTNSVKIAIRIPQDIMDAVGDIQEDETMIENGVLRVPSIASIINKALAIQLGII